MELIHAGSSVLFRAPTDSKPHLWFILTDRISPLNDFVAVMLVSRKSFSDPTVVLEVGEHPFIRHPSCINYSSAKLFKASKLEISLSDGCCHLKEDMSRALLEKVQKGLLESPYTVMAFKECCRNIFSRTV